MEASGLTCLAAQLRVRYVLRTDQRGQTCAHKHLRDGPVEVRNVWTGRLVPIDTFAFAEHMATVRAIIDKVGASPVMLQAL